MLIKIAKNAGFCFGVKRAIELVEENISGMRKPIMMYGYLVHNEDVVQRLVDRGVKIINDLKKATSGTLIITAHGISPRIKEKLLIIKKLNLIDTTCPKVLGVHALAKCLYKEKMRVLIFGDAKHQEVIGINGAINNTGLIFSEESDLARFDFNKGDKYGLIAQTTKAIDNFKKISKKLKKKINNIKIFDTICDASRDRQSETARLAKNNDIILVVGSKKSANTVRLYEIAKEINPCAYFISGPNEIKKEWFSRESRIGITAGASTPRWIIDAVANYALKYCY